MSGAGARRPVVTRGVFAIEDHELLLPDPSLLTVYTDRLRLASCRIKRAH
ncbi:MAG TPA: hypothetical protein VNY27_09460 [Solirubrobacteraceae bacterium]|jgi:hypothetical protein|nr:hypothetical protein [Solirubrobacteraceae bacterium]